MTKTREGSRRFAITLLLAASCLLLLGTVACGPSEREIEATIAARIAEQPRPAPAAQPVPLQESDATATVVAQMPTATVAAGLELPQMTKPAYLATEKMTIEEARKRFRDNGCFECSKAIASVSTSMWSKISDLYDDGSDEFVLLGDFFGQNGLTDAIISISAFYEEDAPGLDFYVSLHSILENNGVTLLERQVTAWGDPGFVYSRNEWLSLRSMLAMKLARINGRPLWFAYQQRRFYAKDLESGAAEHRCIRPDLNFDTECKDEYEIANWWLGDLDDDGDVELGFVDHAKPVLVVEIDGAFSEDKVATAAISQASRDFASNLLTDDADDFELLWREHGPSASVAALALISDMPFHDLLDDLYAAVNKGEDIRETVLGIRESRR